MEPPVLVSVSDPIDTSSTPFVTPLDNHSSLSLASPSQHSLSASDPCTDLTLNLHGTTISHVGLSTDPTSLSTTLGDSTSSSSAAFTASSTQAASSLANNNQNWLPSTTSKHSLPLNTGQSFIAPLPTVPLPTTSWPTPNLSIDVNVPPVLATPSSSATLSAYSTLHSATSAQSNSPTAIFSASSRTSLGSSISSASTSPPPPSLPIGTTAKNTAKAIDKAANSNPRSRKRPRKKPAMSGRPTTKRSVEGSDAALNEASHMSAESNQAGSGKMKLPRLDRGQEDFSSVVKNRLQSYTRTGQACDRCKVRKIRCDALPEGCSHCINLELECYVTDRVTGRTERRGYMQQLEREKNGMVTHIRDLEKLLKDNGLEVRPFKEPKTAKEPHEENEASSGEEQANGDEAASADDSSSRRSSLTGDWTQVGSLWVKNYAGGASIAPSFPRSQLEARPDDNRPRPNAPLSSMRGTSLSILGTTIDTTSFNSPDTDEPPEGANVIPLYNKSVQAYLQSSLRVNPTVQVNLPSREDAFTYAEWYFMTVSTFLPILHKPSLMKLLALMYDDPSFKPSAPELAIVHTIFAIIYFQYSIRNWQQVEQHHHLNELSNKHYHFAISLTYELRCSRDLEAAQALALIASHTRSFPKPGCSGFAASLALQKCIDMGLHRATVKKGEPTTLENELRKRVWWASLMVAVASTGRRGLPVPITVQDFDVDFPEAIADELLTEEGVDTSKTVPCEFEAGIAGFKITPIFMEVYANMYSVRRDPANYTNVVKALEKQLKKWQDELPETLQMKMPQGSEEDTNNIAALYMRFFSLEIRMCLRHPSVALTNDKRMMAENTRICEEVAEDFLYCVKQINQKKALDTTWYALSVYTGCIFSNLVAHWERRFQTNPDEVAKLRKNMNDWVIILKDVSLTMGSGIGIANEIANISSRTISWIEHDMQRSDASRKTASPTVPVTDSSDQSQPSNKKQATTRSRIKKTLKAVSPLKKQQQKQSQTPPQHPVQTVSPPENPMDPHGMSVTPESNNAKDFYQPPQQQQQQQQQQQPPQQQPPQQQQQQQMSDQSGYGGLSYAAQQPANTATASVYQNGHQLFYTTASQSPAIPANMVNANMQSHPLVAFSSQMAQPMSTHSPHDYMWQQGQGNTWQDWTAAIADSQDRYSANALLTLGAGDGRVPINSGVVMHDGSVMNQGHGQAEVPHTGQPNIQWPMVMFDHHTSSG